MTLNATRTWPALILGILLAFSAGHLAWASDVAQSAAIVNPTLQAGLATDSTAKLQKAASAPTINYRARTVNSSWQKWRKNGETAGSTDASLGLIGTAIQLSDDATGSVQYQVHVADVGWLSVASDGTVTKPQNGINRPIDAIRIALVGKISKTYSVSYRSYMPGSGWQAWKSDGAISGDTSKASGIKAVQVKLDKKANESSEGTGILGVRYRTLSQQLGWSGWQEANGIAGQAGKGKRVQGLQIALEKGSYQGSIQYRMRYKNGSWSRWKADGAWTGSNNAVNGIQVRLTGSIAQKYDVVYRAYVQGIGWQRRMRNGETAGTNKNLRIEAIRVDLVAKTNASGWVRKNGKWSYYQSGKKLSARWITTNEHPIATTASGKQRYWLDSKGTLAVARYVNPANTSDKKAGLLAYATDSGYVARGKFKNGDGMILSDKVTGGIYTGTRWLTTNAFDGKQQIYRLVQKGSIAVVKTGLFSVSGKSYYGWPDNRGYLMRSTTKYMNNTWYEADAEGVLTVGSNTNAKAIERYVKWAISIANDNSHGYSQADRWGPDYDCSSLVCASLLAAGFPDSGASWTGNMRACLTKIGFKWHAGTSGLRRGDILLVHNDSNQHTEIFIGSNKLVGAHSSETGGITGKTGDQTGREISVGSYYDMPWDGYLRYKG